VSSIRCSSRFSVISFFLSSFLPCLSLPSRTLCRRVHCLTFLKFSQTRKYFLVLFNCCPLILHYC
jgi:hypothetical protein